MRLTRPTAFLLAVALAAPSIARDPPTPEQRIHKVERQVRAIERQVFPKGAPAATETFDETPAATKDSVDTLTTRLDAVEKQLSDLVRTSEENSHRLSVIETDLARLRADQDSRFKAIESGAPAATTPVPDQPAADTAPARTDDGTTPPPPRAARPARSTAAPAASDFESAGEAAYTQGFDLWTAKQYDQAITQLRAMVSSFRGHRRVSWANNLIGRALLDKGETRAAAAAFLANYRGDTKGERAPDSLYYLGQSTMKLGQPAQACKAYEELSAVYGSTMRAQLKAMLPAARAQAHCK